MIAHHEQELLVRREACAGRINRNAVALLPIGIEHIAQPQAESLPIAQTLLDHFMLVTRDDDDFCNARAREREQDRLDDAALAHADEAFGNFLAVLIEPNAAPGRDDERTCGR